MKNLILVLSAISLCSSYTWSFQDRGEMRVFGSSEIKDVENDDMWDKKNEAVQDAKEKASLALVRRILSQADFEENEERIEDLILPKLDRFVLAADVGKHGLNGNTYSVDVLVKYSIKNLKTMLNNEGIYFNEVKEPKVASFIEVMDYSKIKTHKWWANDQKIPSLHRSLVPLRREISLGMDSHGFKLLPPVRVANSRSLKESAIAQGAHYYIKGKLKVEDNPKGFQVKDGEFYIYEAFSQKLVSTLNLKEMQKQMDKINEEAARSSRGPASVGQRQQKPNVIRESFKDAARKMASVTANQDLNSGITLIKVAGISKPDQVDSAKASLSEKLGSTIGSLIERRIEKGAVEFSVRTSSPTSLLVNMLNRASYTSEELSLHTAEAMSSGKGLVVRVGR